MKVYRLRNDVNRYQFFLAARIEDSLRLGQGTCRPLADEWVPPEVYIPYPFLQRGDFYQFGSGVLIMSPRATEVLYDHLLAAGELLPLPYRDETCTLLNVTECIDCLDQEKSEWLTVPATGQRVYPTKYVFHTDRFMGSQIFKIPETVSVQPPQAGSR